MNATKQSKLGFVVAGLLLGILMAAMDNTIVATSIGTIVSDLGGLDKFVWVTSAYMVASMAGMPIFGKLSDMYGRKRFFIFGLIVFLAGSMLCGIAQSIEQLAIYRAIQGIGGGALMPISFTIMFDLFPPQARGKMSGLFGAVFGTSSVFGPLLGAWITENISWHWVFYINVPIGIVSLFLIASFYKESMQHTKQSIDWIGAITLVGAVVCLMFGLEFGGNQYAWDSAQIISLFAGFAVLFIAFLFAETKAKEPIISFAMFKRRTFATSNAVGFFYGASFIVATVYIPIFVQGVLGGSATNSGLILLPMTVGSVAAAQVGGFLATKFPYRNVMTISALIMLAGIYLLGTLATDTTRGMLTVYMILTGFGVGFSFSILSMSAIEGFSMRERGSASSTNTFMRTLGMTLSVTVFGIVQRNLFSDKMTEAFAGMGAAQSGNSFGNDPRALLSPELRSHIPPQILDKITEALSSSIAHTFLWTLIPAVLALVFVLMMGKARLDRGQAAATPQTKPQA
ncbi:DHA2 family efflux MFS transporter permease subunit [Tumebacillus sp. ITR2]|uniref:DHA2 family efflux MFS transporter permease subunit n=1 Tax=Tumebacillus amylolyticus TaxID=2801339 RepID=A0ABS1J5Y9_9BACL|nr:MDR family MFS transporter [Tumebacillus amylolyticus]MBL0385697.1 DHA2 family efflux MFS transporter permease subunit [Tumebacillus amylolyticus]